MGAIHVLTERKRRRRQVCFSRLVDQNLPTKYQNRYKNSVPLLNRTPDGFTTTSAGQAILRQCEAMESAALALERVAAGRDSLVTGSVRVTTTEALAYQVIAPAIAALRQGWPAMTL